MAPGSRRPEQCPRDLRDLDLVGPAVDLEHLGVPAELLDAVLGHVAVAAEELDGFEADFHRGLRTVELAGARLGQAEAAVPAGELDLLEEEVLDVAPRDFHLRQLELDELEL